MSIERASGSHRAFHGDTVTIPNEEPHVQEVVGAFVTKKQKTNTLSGTLRQPLANIMNLAPSTCLNLNFPPSTEGASTTIGPNVQGTRGSATCKEIGRRETALKAHGGHPKLIRTPTGRPPAMQPRYHNWVRLYTVRHATMDAQKCSVPNT